VRDPTSCRSSTLSAYLDHSTPPKHFSRFPPSISEVISLLAQRSTRSSKQRAKAMLTKRCLCRGLHCYLGPDNRSRKENSDLDCRYHDVHRDQKFPRDIPLWVQLRSMKVYQTLEYESRPLLRFGYAINADVLVKDRSRYMQLALLRPALHVV